MGFVGGQQVDHALTLDFAAGLGDTLIIVGVGIQPQLTQPAPQPADQQGLLVISQMNAAVFVQQAAKAVEVGRKWFPAPWRVLPAESSRPRPKNGENDQCA